MTRLRGLAFGLAALIVAGNFVLVQWVWGFGVIGQTLIPGLADFSPTFNRGVSFSLFAQSSDTGRYFLIGVLAAISIAVAVMAWRAATALTAAGFGLVLGGALGNLWDRVFYGAVFDFLSVHLGNLPLFVCNFADIAISVGVLLLFLDSLLRKPTGARDFAS